MEKFFDKILCTVDFDASSTAVTAENSNPPILMVQPAQDWQRRNVADPLRVPKVGVDLLARKKGPTGRYRVRIPSSLRHPVLDIRHSSRGAFSFRPREFNERRLPLPYFQISSSVPTASNWLHERNGPPSISLEWSRDTEVLAGCARAGIGPPKTPAPPRSSCAWFAGRLVSFFGSRFHETPSMTHACSRGLTGTRLLFG